MKKDPHHSPFYPLEEFSFLAAITENFSLIQGELVKIFDWFEFPDHHQKANSKTYNILGEWKVSPVYVARKFGLDPNKAKELPGRFSELHGILSEIPEINSAGYIRLSPESKLNPHTHDFPVELIYHLGVVIPPNGDAGIQVGDEEYIWKRAGDAIIFDGNFSHGAWNKSKEMDRIVFYVNFDAFDWWD